MGPCVRRDDVLRDIAYDRAQIPFPHRALHRHRHYHRVLAADRADLGRGLHRSHRGIAKFVRDARAREGAVTLFIRHTSASLTIQENADPTVLVDLTTALNRLAPENAGWRHDTEGPDDMVPACAGISSGPFGIMRHPAFSGASRFERRGQIGEHGRIGIFLDCQRRRGVTNEQHYRAFAGARVAHEFRNLGGEIDEACFRCLHGQQRRHDGVAATAEALRESDLAEVMISLNTSSLRRPGPIPRDLDLDVG